MQIKLDGPKTLTLPPEYIALILDMLAQGPYKTVQPVIQHIMNQLQSTE